MGGISSAGSFAPVYDAEKRPITAGGFVTSGPVVFEDATKAAGLSGWQHVMGTKTKKYILETDGSGVGLIDYDNDGWLDIYMVNGSTYDALTGRRTPPHAALFHNNHDGTFTDVAAKAGVTNDRWGFGVAIADYDNDGWPDIFVCNFGKNRLYHNNHDGTFTDVAEKAGVTLGNWSDGATWGDYDGDGRLDLFVSGYVHYDLNHQPDPNNGDVPFGDCQLHGLPVMCGPRGLPGEADHLFHNNGDGTFTDVSVKADVADPGHYYGFTAIFVDVNNDGKPDLLVANDSNPNYLYLNNGDGTFEDRSYVSGFALNNDGREIASMGLAVGDYMNNGLVDLLVTDFSDDYKTLYHNDGDASFTEVGSEAGIAQIPVPFVGWGDGFLDFDNDGWKDIMMINGHVYPQVDEHDWGTTFAAEDSAVSESAKRQVRVCSGGEGVGAGNADFGTRRGVWRSVQQRKDRRGDQPNRWAAGAVEERESGSSSLGGIEAGGRREESAGCRGSDGVSNGERDTAARGRDERRKLHLVERSAAALRAGRCDGCGDGGDSLAIGGEGDGEAAGVDRIFTITEGKGITSVMCAKQPCETKAAHTVKAHKP